MAEPETSKSETVDAEGKGWQDVDIAEVELRDRIGGGGFAIVYRGRWKGQDVAVKTMFDPSADADAKQSYMDELHVMRELNHPNVVKFLGACVKPPKLCFLMELCKGSLYELLHKSGTKIDQLTLMRYAAEVATAMSYLHSRTPGIVHRDLKSHNVLISRDNTIKLCDFGLVSIRATAAGTPAYMAPELLADKPFSRKADVYAFGVLLWEMFTRQIPFEGWRITDVQAHVTGGNRLEWPRGADIPDLIRRMVSACWNQDAAKRPEFAPLIPDLKAWKPTVTRVSQISGGDALDALMSR